ncbi:hypothetical protein SCP_0501060 [Sparassis crispa]|uniref:Uncharacterized protein n=1 Tax=Sparassis crispa TaxID=139825 RepID=A0A401GLM6_9APHY|nr:hypothetical protein SCP_0501060 [Sparassis crispa]GBE83060.1 hypothetical protein SCP_0501060 [Sparassis crispa]
MYPGLEGSEINHKRSYCSDGVKQRPSKIQLMAVGGQIQTIEEDLPSWPQPLGIFTGGTTFNPDIFLETLRKMYDELVLKRESGGALSMEYAAFATLLKKRLKIFDEKDGPAALFELYRALVLKPNRKELVVERDSIRYLRVDCLREGSLSGSGGGGDGGGDSSGSGGSNSGSSDSGGGGSSSSSDPSDHDSELHAI